MKTFIAAALLLAPLFPAGAQSSVPAAQPSASTAALTLDSSIEALMADPAARAVVLASLPDIASSPGYDRFKVVSLRKLQPHSGGLITDEHLAAIEAGLKALPAG